MVSHQRTEFCLVKRTILIICFIYTIFLSNTIMAASFLPVENVPLEIFDNLLLAPSNFSAPEWSLILAKMTAANPCGSSTNFTLCQQCAKSTGNLGAFYFCCVNSDDVRQFCYDFINHTIP